MVEWFCFPSMIQYVWFRIFWFIVEGSLESVGFFLVMVGLVKFLSTNKMMIMLMSLEFCSVFMFFLLVVFSFLSSGLSLGVYSVFLVFLVCESVLILVSMVNIFRKGGLMVKSIFVLKF